MLFSGNLALREVWIWAYVGHDREWLEWEEEGPQFAQQGEFCGLQDWVGWVWLAQVEQVS
jgi:hypothetical protein